MDLKILMVTMGLNIGGAETHIVELSKELKRRGCDVTVASNGGVFVEEIEAYGIHHIEMPLHRRDLGCMVKSYRLLKKVISEEKPDIVHAHARIPAFITGLVRKSVPFNFVTTAHGVYDTSGVLKNLTNWGDKTIAVSEDIRHYLIDSYDVPNQDISITINGIDTQKFSPEISGTGIREEFGIAPDTKLVCHVSRLDEDSAVVCEQLIAAMPLIDSGAVGTQTQLLIAGGGTLFEKLKAQAENINYRLEREAIIMAGPRTDINEVVAACDVFVGVSRTTLEAMAEEKPVVLAGNAGYMGIFKEAQLEEAMSTNFCCRGSEPSNAEKLAGDVCRCFEMLGSEELKGICEFNRKVVIEHYSVGKMTDDCVAVYDIAVRKRYRVLMSGYYGFNNAGDEAILNSIYRNLESMGENISVSVLVANPEKSKDIYDFKRVDRFSCRQVWKALRQCDLLISGGGSLLQDRTSTKSILYYLAIINLAKLMRKKVMLYANGIGPVIKEGNRKLVKRTVNKADLVTLRDENSMLELKDMGVTREDMYITADPVFTFESIGREASQELIRQAGIPSDRPFVGISIRNWYNSEDFSKVIAEICDEIYNKYERNIVFVVMQTPNDIEISQSVQSMMKSPSYILSDRYSTSELMGIVGCADFVLCMRLHTLIFAAHMTVPTLGIVYDPKVRDYLELLGMPSLGDVEHLDKDYALEQIADMIKKREAYAEELVQKTEILKSRAAENEKLLLKLMREEL